MKLLNKILFDSPNGLAALIFGLVSAVILWQMLLPGYILTLDMVFVPQATRGLEFANPDNIAPLRLVIGLLNLVLPAWIIQKVFLWLLFFAMGFLAFRFLPLKNIFAKYWAGVFYMANPFVYERFLAGQWLVLFAYALLPVVSHYTILTFKQRKKIYAIILGGLLAVVSMFSLHIAAMIFILLGFYCIISFVSLLLNKKFDLIFENIKSISLLGVSFMLLAGYWLIGLFGNNFLEQFNQQHFEAFATIADPRVGLTFTVLSLYGFWAEQQPWALQFIRPNSSLILWIPLYLVLAFFVLFGLWKSFGEKEKTTKTWFIVSGLVGFLFAVGINFLFIGKIHQWLFENIWWWAGFRDTSKWSVLIVLAYGYFGGLGAGEVFKFLKKYFNSTFLVTMLLAVPIIYTYPIWGGFSRQLQSVWYPTSWHQAAEVIEKQNSNSKILFLPWHQYYSLSFNNNILTINPAKAFFGGNIIQSHAAELGSVTEQIGDPLAGRVDMVLEESLTLTPDETIKKLANLGITHILVSHDFFDLPNEGIISIFESEYLNVIFSAKDLTFFEIMVR